MAWTPGFTRDGRILNTTQRMGLYAWQWCYCGPQLPFLVQKVGETQIGKQPRFEYLPYSNLCIPRETQRRPGREGGSQSTVTTPLPGKLQLRQDLDQMHSLSMLPAWQAKLTPSLSQSGSARPAGVWAGSKQLATKALWLSRSAAALQAHSWHSSLCSAVMRCPVGEPTSHLTSSPPVAKQMASSLT